MPGREAKGPFRLWCHPLGGVPPFAENAVCVVPAIFAPNGGTQQVFLGVISGGRTTNPQTRNLSERLNRTAKFTEGVTMGTTQNSAAIYVRRSAVDERDTDDSDFIFIDPFSLQKTRLLLHA